MLCLAGADSIEGAQILYQQHIELFHRSGFLLQKWNSSESVMLDFIEPELCDFLYLNLSYTKTIKLEWNTITYHFCVTVNLSSQNVFLFSILPRYWISWDGFLL